MKRFLRLAVVMVLSSVMWGQDYNIHVVATAVIKGANVALVHMDGTEPAAGGILFCVPQDYRDNTCEPMAKSSLYRGLSLDESTADATSKGVMTLQRQGAPFLFRYTVVRSSGLRYCETDSDGTVGCYIALWAKQQMQESKWSKAKTLEQTLDFTCAADVTEIGPYAKATMYVGRIHAVSAPTNYDEWININCVKGAEGCNPVTKGKRYLAQITIHNLDGHIAFIDSPDHNLNHAKVVAVYNIGRQ